MEHDFPDQESMLDRLFDSDNGDLFGKIVVAVTDPLRIYSGEY